MAARTVLGFQSSVTGKRWLWIGVCGILLLLAACGARPASISRVALLAPFEGRYREVGYQALHAARLAALDSGGTSVELLAIDDGGSVASAVDRARALAGDPLVKVVVALGYAATAPETQRALGDKPMLIAGSWGAQPETPGVFVLASPSLAGTLTAETRVEVTEAARLEAPLVGGDVFALQQFARLRSSLDRLKVVSSGSLPDAAFTERYQQTGLFVPQPGPLAALAYDAFGLLFMAVRSPDENLKVTLSNITYDGYNGLIRFEGGWWQDAPLHYYIYDEICLERRQQMCLIPASQTPVEAAP
jgi:ABC-type branched-subunit amino acid transport system substrate-binding protein